MHLLAGELMMSLLWYYRPEHTQGGRNPSMHQVRRTDTTLGVRASIASVLLWGEGISPGVSQYLWVGSKSGLSCWFG